MAPEIVLGHKYSGYKADIFSAGVILFTLARGIFPFMGSNEQDQFYVHLFNKNYPEYWDSVEGNDASPEFKDLAQRLLAHNPEDRPNLEKLKSHPWMTAQGQSSDSECKQMIAEKIMKLREEKRQYRLSKEKAKGYKNKETYSRGAESDEN